MFNREELKELAEYKSHVSPVLSVYLNVDSTQVTTDQYRLSLKGVLKSVADQAAHPDVEAVEKYIEFEYDRQSRGIVIFSCTGDSFWRVYPLAVPVPDQAYVALQPYIKPLADVLDVYGRYGVVLVDREGAKLYLFDLGALQDVIGTYGEELRETIRSAAGRGGRSGSGSGRNPQANLQNRLDQVTNRNLREVIALTEEFYQTGKCDQIILAGTDENRARFTALLSKSLQTKVVGSFPVDMLAPIAEVSERSLQVIRDAEVKRKASLVQSVITAARKGNASLGLSDTLLAVQEQRVKKLVVHVKFHVPGSVCTHCNYVTTKQVDQCPICEGESRIVDDIVDNLVRRAIINDAKVIFVQDEALAQDGIGALWRY